MPKNGNIVVKKLGKWTIINKNDIVDTKMLKDFIYDQGENGCSEKQQNKCDDEFKFVPFGEWKGQGEY